MKAMITGGVKSGKSSYALSLAENFQGKKVFLATAEAFDDEMRDKIERHQKERGDSFITIEEPIKIDHIIESNLILDCITLWMNNILFNSLEDQWEDILTRFLTQMQENTIIVTNETGLGNIPANELTRRYNRYLGLANRLVAQAVDDVYFMVAGIPLKIK